MSAAAQLFLLSLASAPTPSPGGLTGTSSVAITAPSPARVRVEQRSFDKEGRIFTRALFAWWSRADLRLDPGVTGEATYYFSERFGLDLLSVTGFFSSLESTAAELRRSTGRLPDSQAPILRLMTGARYAFAYGKFLIEGPDLVVHADLGAVARAGVIITDASVNPSADLGLGLQLRLGEHGLVAAEACWLGGYEERTTTSFAGGLMLSIGVGLRI